MYNSGNEDGSKAFVCNGYIYSLQHVGLPLFLPPGKIWMLGEVGPGPSYWMTRNGR